MCYFNEHKHQWAAIKFDTHLSINIELLLED